MSESATAHHAPTGDHHPRTDVAVVGAGLAGLAAARLLQRKGLSVVVFDPQPAGGRGRTDERRGYLFNRGPHALYLGGHAARVLADLGVDLPGKPPSDGCGVLGGRLGVLPGGPVGLLRTSLLGARGKVAAGRLLSGLPKVKTTELGTVPFSDWLDGQRLPDDARRLVEAVARVASYSNAPSIASADVVVSQIQLALGSGVRYLDGGWQSIVDALAAGLPLRREAVRGLERGPSGDIAVSLADGSELAAGAVVLAVGTPTATASLLGRAPFDVGPPIEAACLDLGTDCSAEPGLLLGLDEPLYLSDHGGSARLAPHGRSVVHVARYLAPGEQPEPSAQTAELLRFAALAGITDDHIVERRSLHRMTVAGALPTAAHGGLGGRPTTTASGAEGVFLAGDWVGSRGHLLDASLASAEDAVAAAVRLVRR